MEVEPSLDNLKIPCGTFGTWHGTKILVESLWEKIVKNYLHKKQLGFSGFHLPLTHLAVLLVDKFEP